MFSNVFWRPMEFQDTSLDEDRNDALSNHLCCLQDSLRCILLKGSRGISCVFEAELGQISREIVDLLRFSNRAIFVMDFPTLRKKYPFALKRCKMFVMTHNSSWWNRLFFSNTIIPEVYVSFSFGCVGTVALRL